MKVWRLRGHDLLTIMGLDPGTRWAGVGFVTLNAARQIQHVHHELLVLPPKAHLAERLLHLDSHLSELLERFKPQHVAVEQIFLGKNADSAFKLGHARGVCLMNVHKSGAEVFEYAPKSIKKGVTGMGSAGKEQVQMVVKNLLALPQNLDMKDDVSDALAVAIHHARYIQVQQKLRNQGANL